MLTISVRTGTGTLENKEHYNRSTEYPGWLLLLLLLLRYWLSVVSCQLSVKELCQIQSQGMCIRYVRVELWQELSTSNSMGHGWSSLADLHVGAYHKNFHV